MLRRSTTIIALVGTLAALLSLLTPGPGFADKEKKKTLVGKPLPATVAGVYHNGEPLPGRTINQSLEDACFVVAIVKLSSPRWNDLLDLFNRIHRPAEEGGPVVFAFTFDSRAKTRKIIDETATKPRFYIAGDRRGKVYKEFGKGVYPQIYVVDEKGTVTWEGSGLSGGFQKVIQKLIGGDIPRLADSVAEKPKRSGSKGESPAEDDEQKSEDKHAAFRARIEKAMSRNDTDECIRLLRLAWKKDRRPQNDLVGPLWDHIESAIAKEAAPALKRINRGKYGVARKDIVALRGRYPDFPSATLKSAWAQLAELEGEKWYEGAKFSLASGDTAGARELVSKLTNTYPESTWAQKAKELLP